MNSLAYSVLIIVGLAILGVVLYNWRQGAGKPQGSKTAALKRSEQDPLLEPASFTPTQPVGARAASAEPEHHLDLGEPLVPRPINEGLAPGVAANARGLPAIDERLDAIVSIQLPHAIPGDRLLALTAGLRRAGNKPVLIEAAGAGGWQPLVSNDSFDALRLGVLLSNRLGPLNGIEYSEFVSALQPLGEHLEVMIDPPPMAQVIANARELDEMCASLDAQVGLNIETTLALSTEQLEAVAEQAGLIERGNTRYVATAPTGEPMFTVSLSNQANRLSFNLDVPRVAERHNPWARMVDCAQSCATQLGGQIVDDEGRALSADHMRRIGEQLGQRYQELAQAGLEAGSPAAVRTFS
jgi:ZipA, C-terminal FtsZ-binding domain